MPARSENPIYDPSVRIPVLLGKDPSRGDFPQSIVGYCDEAVEVSLAKISTRLTKDFPDHAERINTLVRKIPKSVQLPSSSNLSFEEEQVVLHTPNNFKFPVNEVLSSVYHANPQLGQFHYAIALYPARSKREEPFHYPGFNQRHKRVSELGNFSPNHPVLKIMAVAYITEVAKLEGITHAKELLKYAASFGGLTGVEYIDTRLSKIEEQVKTIRKDQAFIRTGLATIETIAGDEGLTDEQVQLIHDLAFFSSRAFDQLPEYRAALGPIVQCISESRWQEALDHRDFLLKYFLTAFPEWRRKEFQRTTPTPSYESFKHIVQAATKGLLTLNEDEVPAGYRDLFGQHLQKKVARSEREKQIDIIRRSTRLSNRIIEILSGNSFGETPEGRFYEIDFTDAPEGFIEVSLVEVKGTTQICIIAAEGGMRHRNFGVLLYSLIHAAQNHDEQHPSFLTNELPVLRRVLEAAYHEERVRPEFYYSLREYLEAIIFSGKHNLDPNDPVMQFIHSF